MTVVNDFQHPVLQSANGKRMAVWWWPFAEKKRCSGLGSNSHQSDARDAAVLSDTARANDEQRQAKASASIESLV